MWTFCGWTIGIGWTEILNSLFSQPQRTYNFYFALRTQSVLSFVMETRAQQRTKSADQNFVQPEPDKHSAEDNTKNDGNFSNIRDLDDNDYRNSQNEYTKCPRCGVYTKEIAKHLLSHTDPYKCSSCDSHFRNKAKLLEHNRKNHPQPESTSINCSYCWKTFGSSATLSEHINEIHTGLNNSFECEICGKPCPDNRALALHTLVHTNKKSHKCKVCNKVYALESSLKVHMQNHTEKKLHCCDICSKGFSRKGRLDAHRLTHTHQHAKPKWKKCGHVTPSYKASNNNFPIFCKGCGGAAVCNYCGYAFENRRQYKAHTHNLLCLTCGIKFFDARFYSKHLVYHKKSTKFKCESCKFGFNALKDFALHQAKQHKIYADKKSPKINHECTQCEKKYSTYQALKFHEIRVHNSVQTDTFTCSECSKVFVSETILKIHERIHKPEMHKFQCEVCEKSFTRKTDLNRHVNSHSSDKNFICLICGVSVKSNRNLTLHLDTHQNTSKSCQCEECGKCFRQKCYLKVHQKIHDSDGKPYKCNLCSKSYLNKQGLDEHMPTHTGKSKYKCDHCCKYFCSSFSFKKHVDNKYCWKLDSLEIGAEDLSNSESGEEEITDTENTDKDLSDADAELLDKEDSE